jgi:hypothetical protein
VSQDVSLKISVLDGSMTGATVYSEVQNVTTSEFVLFALAIGTGTVESGEFAAISWGGGSKFLKVEMDVAGGTDFVEMGTSQLLSTPYALYAETSGDGGSSVWSKTDNLAHYTEGQVVVGSETAHDHYQSSVYSKMILCYQQVVQFLI